MKNLRITIEVPCSECKNGKVEIHLCDVQKIEDFDCPGVGLCGEVQTVKCSDCDGTGYQEEKLTLELIKKMLGDI